MSALSGLMVRQGLRDLSFASALGAVTGASIGVAAMFSTLDAMAAEGPKVVTSITPVHGLVAGVMQGVGTPSLLLDSNVSPHAFSMKPSHAKLLESADIVFWIGRDIETFLEKPLGSLAADAQAVSLLEAPGLKKLPFREGGPFEAHDDHDHGAEEHEEHEEHAHEEHDEHEKHEEHDEHKHDEHAHDDHDEHKEEEHAHDEHEEHDEHAHDEHEEHDEHAHDEHGHDEHDEHDEHKDEEHAHEGHGHDEHGHGEVDAHIWLDPKNAQALVAQIAAVLSEADPAHASVYAKNAANMTASLETLITELDARLAPVRDRGFIVFHDAYQYFETRFDLAASGSITVSPETPPSAKRVSEIKDKISDLSVGCVFSEPQFEPRIVSVVTEGTSAKTGVLDPLGADIVVTETSGAEPYFALLRNMATSFETCLTPQS